MVMSFNVSWFIGYGFLWFGQLQLAMADAMLLHPWIKLNGNSLIGSIGLGFYYFQHYVHMARIMCLLHAFQFVNIDWKTWEPGGIYRTSFAASLCIGLNAKIRVVTIVQAHTSLALQSDANALLREGITSFFRLPKGMIVPPAAKLSDTGNSLDGVMLFKGLHLGVYKLQFHEYYWDPGGCLLSVLSGPRTRDSPCVLGYTIQDSFYTLRLPSSESVFFFQWEIAWSFIWASTASSTQGCIKFFYEQVINTQGDSSLPWDPGGTFPSAWGQAESQGEEYVTHLVHPWRQTQRNTRLNGVLIRSSQTLFSPTQLRSVNQAEAYVKEGPKEEKASKIM